MAATAAGGMLDILLTLGMFISTNLYRLYVCSIKHILFLGYRVAPFLGFTAGDGFGATIRHRNLSSAIKPL
jgi:hypothetical protein